jgi:DnaJ-domain-containing protein 1
VVYWAVERPSTEASGRATQDDADHPALQDFLHEVRSSRSKTVNEALERKLYDVAERVVSITVSRDVDDASNRAVWRTVASPAGLSVFEEVYRATEVDPISSALQDFLHEAEAVRSDPEGPGDAASVYG